MRGEEPGDSECGYLFQEYWQKWEHKHQAVTREGYGVTRGFFVFKIEGTE